MSLSSIPPELRCAERVRETPDRSRLEFFVLRFEVPFAPGLGEMFCSFPLAFHERFVDHHLSRDVRQFTFLPGFHLPPHRLKVSRCGFAFCQALVCFTAGSTRRKSLGGS